MLLQMSLAPTGASGVIGFDLFNYFSVMLDMRGNLLKLRKSTAA